MKNRVYKLLNESHRTGSAAWFVDVFIIGLVALNVLAIVLESVPSLQRRFGAVFNAFELFSVAVFTVEYVLRAWSASADPRFRAPVLGNLRYMATPLALIDLLAILPAYLPLLGVDMRLLRILRLFRLFRIFKTVRYLKALTLIGGVVHDKKEELTIAVIFTMFMLLIASTLMYYVETTAQPEKFSSIPETMWWGIATLTTVGYGDVYPITPLGQLLGGLIAVFGIGMFALPAGILASGFSEALAHRHAHAVCPHCGGELPHKH